jgi:hypothetical protein
MGSICSKNKERNEDSFGDVCKRTTVGDIEGVGD